MSTKKYVCQACNREYTNKQNLNRHVNSGKCGNGSDVSSLSSNDNYVEPTINKNININSDTEMMILLLKQNEEFKQEIKRLKNKIIDLEEENKKYKIKEEELKLNSLDQKIKPYNQEQLTENIFKFNPYLKRNTVYRNGFSPKDYKNQWILKSIDPNDYPTTNVKFYKKCFNEILSKIKNDKLPYRVRDANRNLFDIYDYGNNIWIKGETNNLINLVIKPLAKKINYCITMAMSNMETYLQGEDYRMHYRCGNDVKKCKDKINDLRIHITNNYSLPDYDMDLDDDDVNIFYKKNFINSCFIERFKNKENDENLEEQQNEDEEYEFEEIEPINNMKMKKQLTIRNNVNNVNNKYYDDDDNDDDGYQTDTDPKYYSGVFDDVSETKQIKKKK